jgi:hypothetical protein
MTCQQERWLSSRRRPAPSSDMEVGQVVDAGENGFCVRHHSCRTRRGGVDDPCRRGEHGPGVARGNMTGNCAKFRRGREGHVQAHGKSRRNVSGKHPVGPWHEEDVDREEERRRHSRGNAVEPLQQPSATHFVREGEVERSTRTAPSTSTRATRRTVVRPTLRLPREYPR